MLPPRSFAWLSPGQGSYSAVVSLEFPSAKAYPFIRNTWAEHSHDSALFFPFGTPRLLCSRTAHRMKKKIQARAGPMVPDDLAETCPLRALRDVMNQIPWFSC